MDNFTREVVENVGEIAKVTFSWYDYSLFGTMMIVSILIGIYFGCFGNKQSSANEYLLGEKSMGVFPIAMSLVASQISGLTMLAVPSEVYVFGITYWLSIVAIVFANLLNSYIFFPVFNKCQVISTYEYLKLRFDRKIQQICSFLFTMSFALYLPITIYIPALAFSQATGANIHIITPCVCLICIFYTTIGGLKAVVWTDTIQFISIIIGIVSVIYVGIVSVGGWNQIWYNANLGDRLSFDFDINPTKRDSFWAALFGLVAIWTSFVATYQGSVQKFIALGSIKQARKAMLIVTIGMVIIFSSSIFLGLIIYAKYANCDPFSTKKIITHDQLVPYFVLDVAGKIPGLPGLFISGIFCAALSTLSACMNALAGTIYEDFITPFVKKDISEKTVSNILKLIVLISGAISTAMVFVIERLGGLLPLAFSFSGATHGPIAGLFSFGMLAPSANTKGALWGGIAAILFECWIVFGAQIYKAMGLLKYPSKPLSTEGCDFFLNKTFDALSNTTLSSETYEPFFVYRISYYYYTLLAILIVFAIGLPVSWLTRDEDEVVNPDLISPVSHWLLPKEKDKKYYSIHKGMQVLTVHGNNIES